MSSAELAEELVERWLTVAFYFGGLLVVAIVFWPRSRGNIRQYERSETQQRIVSDVSPLLYDYPIRLLCLNDFRLYTRSQITLALAEEIAQTLGDGDETYHETVIRNKFSVLTRYAIFSHRWGADELTYRGDFRKVLASQRSGAVKIRKFCELARHYGCRYVWFDTGCIDSSNSSELDESIRSMYTWYDKAHVCIVHLGQTGSALLKDDGVDEWFRRGWTLQELLAPQRLKFYNKDWDGLTEQEYDICREAPTPTSLAIIKDISKCTGIDEASLRSFRPHDMNVRRVLTWVSRRRTSRPEDIVYCLFGLLDVSLNVAYGEGQEKAFTRLQIELLRRYDDRSLFFFTGESSSRNPMIARSPSAFSSPFPGIVLPSDTLLFREHITTPDISMTIYGLHMAIVLYNVDKYYPTPSPSFISVQDLGNLPCSLKDPTSIDDQAKLFFGILGHAQPKGGRFFFGILLCQRINMPSRYHRLLTDPPILELGALKISTNQLQDELVSLKEPEMVYIE